MKKSELKKEYLDEKSFWHITSKLNIDSIEKNGLVPRDGNRNGLNKSLEDPVPRVFFSQGLEGVLAQANNLAYLVNNFLNNIERTNNGENGKNTKNKMNEFLNKGVNSKMEKYENGGFIDIVTFLKEDIFKNGINEKLTEEDIDRITYDITKTIWENDVCLKANLREEIDYSWKDTNYNAKGTRKTPMTKKNMHAFEGHRINTDLLEIISDKKGKPRTTWDVFKEMSLFYKKEYPNKKYLPVEEWKTGKDKYGEIIYAGHRKDYLSMFIEMEKSEKEKIVEKYNIEKSSKIFSKQQIGKLTINTLTKQKDAAYNKILDKVYERNHSEEMYEHKIDK